MPNQGVPVIFKNKIAYGYAEKSVQAYDVSVSDYNALTEQQQLDGSIRFIQGVDAIPNGSNVWAKLGTTPLAEGLPRDCSQAVNELKSNLTDLAKVETFTVSPASGVTFSRTTLSKQGNIVRLRIATTSFTTSANAYKTVATIPSECRPKTTDSEFITCTPLAVTSNNACYVRISTAGTVDVYATSSTTYASGIYIDVTYMILES